MATGTIEKVTPIYGVESSDEQSVYCKFPDGTIMEWGSIAVEANAYVTTRYFGNRFARIDSIIVTPKDENITAFSVKSTNNAVKFSRRPITNTNSLNFLVIGRWK